MISLTREQWEAYQRQCKSSGMSCCISGVSAPWGETIVNDNCWKCSLPITDECPSDGLTYTSLPPRYAHKNCPSKCDCPNCGQDLVESLCAGCGHDGLRGDCGCEFCSTPPTADMPPIGTSVLYRCFYWVDVADAMEKASWEYFKQTSLPFEKETAIPETYYRKWLGS